MKILPSTYEKGDCPAKKTCVAVEIQKDCPLDTSLSSSSREAATFRSRLVFSAEQLKESGNELERRDTENRSGG